MSFEYKKRERGKFHIDPFFDLVGGETRPSPLTLIRPPATFSLRERVGERESAENCNELQCAINLTDLRMEAVN